MQVCTGCGSIRSIEEIRAVHPDAVACCPERKMVEVDILELLARVERLEVAVRELNPGLAL